MTLKEAWETRLEMRRAARGLLKQADECWLESENVAREAYKDYVEADKIHGNMSRGLLAKAERVCLEGALKYADSSGRSAKAKGLAASADRLFAEGNLIWANAWIENKGEDTVIDWNWKE